MELIAYLSSQVNKRFQAKLGFLKELKKSSRKSRHAFLSRSVSFLLESNITLQVRSLEKSNGLIVYFSGFDAQVFV